MVKHSLTQSVTPFQKKSQYYIPEMDAERALLSRVEGYEKAKILRTYRKVPAIYVVVSVDIYVPRKRGRVYLA